MIRQLPDPDDIQRTKAVLVKLYGDRWSISYFDGTWLASNRDPDSPYVPTIIEDRLERLLPALDDPSPVGGRRRHAHPRPEGARP